MFIHCLLDDLNMKTVCGCGAGRCVALSFLSGLHCRFMNKT